MDIEAFRADFLNDVHIQVASDGGFTDNAFMEVAAVRLEEANEVTNFEPCHYRSPSGRMRIDGYSFDAADDSLRVFIVHRKGQDELETLTKTEARPIFSRLVAFVDAALGGGFEKSIDENHPARDFAESVNEQRSSLSRIRAYLVTDAVLSAQVKDWPEGTVKGVPVEFHIWDIGRFYRAQMSSTGLDEVLVDFRVNGSSGIPCLDASMPGSPYRSYLCALPASLLSSIYDAYGSRLLEGNVRSFLTAKGKINQGIRRTLLEAPEMFFAYNNGISAVASDVSVVQSADGHRLVSALNLQIVNGGQTTASIANVDRVDKAPHLAETFVPMKLSVVEGERAVTMVADISRFANSQNKVSDADFFSNHPFHQRIEQISRRLLAPARNGMQYETRWYYERARGQYLNEFLKLTPAQRDRLKLVIPKNQVITKTDLAKSELSWQQKPHTVSLGAQTFFQEFAKRIDAEWVADTEAFHEEYFRDAVARIIVFRGSEQLVSSQPWYYGGYRAIIVTYTLAKLAHDLAAARRGVIDYNRIWRNQESYPELIEVIAEMSREVFESLSVLPEAQKNLTQWAKRQGCWEQIRKLPSRLPEAFLRTLVDPAETVKAARAARAVQIIDSGIDQQAAVLSLGSAFWKAAFDWAESRGGLAPSDRQALVAAAGAPFSMPNERQSKRLLDLKKRFEDAGFIPTVGDHVTTPL